MNFPEGITAAEQLTATNGNEHLGQVMYPNSLLFISKYCKHTSKEWHKFGLQPEVGTHSARQATHMR